MHLMERLRQQVDLRGAEFLGIADLVPGRDELERQGGAAVAAYPRGISIGIALPDDIVDLLPQGRERSVATDYRHHAYDTINTRLDLLASEVSSLVQAAGHCARPVPASRSINSADLEALLSHKLVAHLAGLGWIGKSCLLVTPERGPRVRWATVLTDAPLEPTGGPREPACGECRECVDICPAQAFTGRLFDPAEPRAARYDAHACAAHFASLREEGHDPAVCGLCLYVCPHGRVDA